MKRLLLFLLCAAVIMLTAASCKKQGTAAEPVTAKVKNVYRSDFVALPENYSMNGRIFISGGRIYMLCSELLDEETYDQRTVLYSLDTNGENPESEVIEPSSENSYIYQFAVLPDGSRVFVENSYDQEAQKQTYTLTKTAPDGTRIFSADVEPMFPAADPAFGGAPWFNIQYMAVDGEGIVYLTSDAAVVAVSPDGTKLFDITVSGFINELTASADGRVFAKFYDRSSSSGGQALKYIDPKKKGFGESVSLPSTINANNYETFIGPGYDFYLKDSTAVYGCNADSAEPKELMNFINSDINPNSVQSLIILDSEKFLYTGYDNVTRKQQIAFLKRIPDSEVKEKYIINLSYVNAGYDLASYVVKFNQTNETYRIILNDYAKYNTQDNYNLGWTTLTNEIIAGKVPDILILGSSTLDMQNFIDKGLFCDLYQYLDNDPDISRGDLLKCVTVPFETDGKLYRLVTDFYIQTLAGKTANIGDAESWTVGEMLAALENAGEGVTLFKDATKNSMFGYFYSMGFSEFIDFENASCSFNSEAFIKLLEYCDTLPSENTQSPGRIEYDQEEDIYIQYREDKVLLYNAHLMSFSDYLMTKFVFGFEPINLIGYPTSSGCGAIIQAGSSYAIAEKSPVKDGAWQFLKYLLSDECQISDNRMSRFGWPVTYSALEAAAIQEMERYYFFRYSGGWSSSSQPMNEDMLREPGLPGRLTQEDVDFITAYLDKINAAPDFDIKIYEMINEETQAFFAGSKTAAEAAEIIQSRVSIYINETR